MGNIFADIVEEIEVKPRKSKVILKWTVRVAAILIAGAFTYGQVKMGRTARVNILETSISELRVSQKEDFAKVNGKLDEIDENFNARIDKVYDDANEGLLEYQEYNKKQLELIIDYGAENKDLLKRMLELNSLENARKVGANLERAKNESNDLEIGVRPVEPKEFYSMVHTIKTDSDDTTFNITGATQEYIDKLNKNLYVLGEITPSERYTGRFDFNYRNK